MRDLKGRQFEEKRHCVLPTIPYQSEHKAKNLITTTKLYLAICSLPRLIFNNPVGFIHELRRCTLLEKNLGCSSHAEKAGNSHLLFKNISNSGSGLILFEAPS